MRGRLKTTVVHMLRFFELRHRSNHILESCRSGVMVSISAFQALDPGSIPGCDILFVLCALKCAYFQPIRTTFRREMSSPILFFWSPLVRGFSVTRAGVWVEYMRTLTDLWSNWRSFGRVISSPDVLLVSIEAAPSLSLKPRDSDPACVWFARIWPSSDAPSNFYRMSVDLKDDIIAIAFQTLVIRLTLPVC